MDAAPGDESESSAGNAFEGALQRERRVRQCEAGDLEVGELRRLSGSKRGGGTEQECAPREVGGRHWVIILPLPGWADIYCRKKRKTSKIMRSLRSAISEI